MTSTAKGKLKKSNNVATSKSLKSLRDNNSDPQDFLPEFVGEAFASSVNQSKASFYNRISGRNKTGLGEKDKSCYFNLDNIQEGFVPFKQSDSRWNIREAVVLCQKAYYNVSAMKMTIDTLTEFANSDIYLEGKNKRAKRFIEDWLKKIRVYNLSDQFFREWWRSSNVLCYRFDADISLDALRDLARTYGVSEVDIKNINLPIRYVLLNPADIEVDTGLMSDDDVYFKLLSNYEIKRLRNSKVEEDILFLKSLDKSIRDSIQTKDKDVAIPLDHSRLFAIFGKKQDYEPFAVPMFLSVLPDIDLKLQFKKMESVIARTVEYIILLVTIGSEENPNPEGIAALKSAFKEGSSIGRVLVSDGTTKVDFVIPDINKVLGSEKYKQVNEDISNAFMNVFYGDQKFANAQIKVSIFLERLNEARRVFLDEFLNPEIKRVCNELGFKNFPIAKFTEVSLQDRVAMQRIYTRLMELNILTPEEGLEAMQNGRLPNPEDSLESQEKYKELRDKGYYYPVVGGSQPANSSGRPEGTDGIPQSTRESAPIGTGSVINKGKDKDNKELEAKYSINKLTDLIILSGKLRKKLHIEAKKLFKVKKLSKTQEESLTSISELIIANEQPEKWEVMAKNYLKSPKQMNEASAEKIDNIMARYDVESYLAAFLTHCEIKDKKNND